MPLRDHFRPPVDNICSWEELHGQWPAWIVHHLHQKLPEGFAAGPRVHSGSAIEIDVAAFQEDFTSRNGVPDSGSGGVATAVWAPSRPTLSVETTLPDVDEYEVRIYDARRGRRLVAAIEIVSPANKDRPESRNAFIGKCAALLQKGIAVSIVDLVTVRHFNLYADLLEFIGHDDPHLSNPPPEVYAVSCRYVRREKQTFLEAWSQVLAIGQPLPTLPLWLTSDLSIPLELEASYEGACRDLRIP